MESHGLPGTWAPEDFVTPMLTVLATDLRGSTDFFRQCSYKDVELLIQDLSSSTWLILNDIGKRTTRPWFPASFVGDGHLAFLAETLGPSHAQYEIAQSHAYPTGPARALIAARLLVHQFAAFRRDGIPGLSPYAHDALQRVTLACAIGYGEVHYGPFGSPYVQGHTGLLETVTTTFRLTKLTFDADNRHDYIAVTQPARRLIQSVQGLGADGIPETPHSPAHASVRGQPLHRYLGQLKFAEQTDLLSGLGAVTLCKVTWPDFP